MRPRLHGGLATAAGLCALVSGLAIIDPRVRGEIARVLSSPPPAQELSSVGEIVRQFGFIVFQALRDQTIEHAPLVIFGLAAMVLVLLMSRT